MNCRFSRYGIEVGRGRFKHVYKGFDEKQGIDVAWSKVLQEHNQLTDEQMAIIATEMKVGLDQVCVSQAAARECCLRAGNPMEHPTQISLCTHVVL